MTTEKSEAISMLSDIYKDAYGMRPRTVYNYDAMSVEDVYAEIDVVHAVSLENMKREELHAAECDVVFAGLVQKTINLGAGDEKTALKWIYDGSGAGDEFDYFELESLLYQNGIMHTDYGKSIKAKLIAIYGN